MSRNAPIVPAPPDPSTPIGLIVTLYSELDRVEARHGEGSPELSAIRRRLCALWETLTPAEMRAAIDAVTPIVQRRSHLNAMPEVEALLAAGWTPEWEENGDREPFAWSWRRPPRRPGAAGAGGEGEAVREHETGIQRNAEGGRVEWVSPWNFTLRSYGTATLAGPRTSPARSRSAPRKPEPAWATRTTRT